MICQSDDISKFLPLINTSVLLRKSPPEVTYKGIKGKTRPGLIDSGDKLHKKSNSKHGLRPTSFSEFRPRYQGKVIIFFIIHDIFKSTVSRTKSPLGEKRKIQKGSKVQQPKDVNEILKQVSLRTTLLNLTNKVQQKKID